MVLPILGKAHELPPKRGKTSTEFLASFCPPIQYLPCNPYSLKECNKRSRLSDKTDDCFVSRPARMRQTQDPQLRRLLTYFDSRTREGCDRELLRLVRVQGRFNSRTRKGRDLGLSEMDLLISSFNSRTREGCEMSLPAG